MARSSRGENNLETRRNNAPRKSTPWDEWLALGRIEYTGVNASQAVQLTAATSGSQRKAFLSGTDALRVRWSSDEATSKRLLASIERDYDVSPLLTHMTDTYYGSDRMALNGIWLRWRDSTRPQAVTSAHGLFMNGSSGRGDEDHQDHQDHQDEQSGNIASLANDHDAPSSKRKRAAGAAGAAGGNGTQDLWEGVCSLRNGHALMPLWTLRIVQDWREFPFLPKAGNDRPTGRCIESPCQDRRDEGADLNDAAAAANDDERKPTSLSSDATDNDGGGEDVPPARAFGHPPLPLSPDASRRAGTADAAIALVRTAVFTDEKHVDRLLKAAHAVPQHWMPSAMEDVDERLRSYGPFARMTFMRAHLPWPKPSSSSSSVAAVCSNGSPTGYVPIHVDRLSLGGLCVDQARTTIQGSAMIQTVAQADWLARYLDASGVSIDAPSPPSKIGIYLQRRRPALYSRMSRIDAASGRPHMY